MELTTKELIRIRGKWFGCIQVSRAYDKVDWEIADKIHDEIRKREMKGE